MKTELKEKWLEALRSGEYEQTQGMLCRLQYNRDTSSVDESFCCLGVLYDISGGEWYSEEPNTKTILVEAEDKDGNPYKTTSEGELDQDTKEEFGLTDKQCEILMAMNDGRTAVGGCQTSIRQHTFAEIADHIEENIE